MSTSFWKQLEAVFRPASARENFIANYEFSRGLRGKFAAAHPQLNAEGCNLVFDGLREYFQICRAARRRMVSMPSQVVDDAWHEFILFTRDYQEFCDAAFGRFLHHTPAAAMETPTRAQDGIRRAWRLACARESINSLAPTRLPLLFALDSQLQIPGGLVYSLDCLAGRRGDSQSYCATHIGCGGGCSGGGDNGDSSGDGGGDSSCGGGCGGGD